MYMTEELLCAAFKNSCRGVEFHSQYKLGRGRVDGVLTMEGVVKLGIEFDGSFHYTSTRQVLSDRSRDLEFNNMGARLLRWPYWLQPSDEVLTHFKCFEIRDFVESAYDYPQGFISTERSCVLPADFCRYGYDRFISEIYALPVAVVDEIVSNLRKRSITDVVAKASLEMIISDLSIQRNG